MQSKGKILVTLFLLFNASFVFASDGPEYSVKSIKGHYGYSGGTGFVVPPVVPQNTPIIGLGTVYFDGAGLCEVRSMVNFAGNLVGPLQSSSCEYTVDEDGMGSSVAIFPDAPFEPESPVRFVIVDNGKEIRFINSGVMVGGFVAKKQ